MPPSASEQAAAAALERAGFRGVRFLPPDAARREADLLAERGGVLWAVEVRASSRPLRADASFEPPDERPLPYPALTDYFALIWKEKRAQLEATRAAHGCGAAMLLVVVEGVAAAAWESALARARAQAGSPAVSFAVCAAGRIIASPSLD